MNIVQLEDIRARKEAGMLGKNIYSIKDRNDRFRRDLRFKSQMTSEAVSIVSNIAKGFPGDQQRI